MPSAQLPLFALMLLAGMGIPVMAALNAKLGADLGSPLLAVVILCLVAAAAATVLLIAQSGPAYAPGPVIRPFYFLAGLLFVFYIGAITYSAPRIGLGGAVSLVILGQVLSAALIDHQGWFGTPITALTWKRGLGLVLMVAGVLLARSPAPAAVLGR